MGLFGDDNSGNQYLLEALQNYKNISTPTIAAEQVNNLPEETVQGAINPNQIQVAEQAPSEYGNISLDPTTRQAQINALKSYQTMADEGGLDAESKLSMQQAIDAANTQSQGAQGAIQNQAQAMGQGGGDFALTQRAIAAQGASNNAANQGMQAAALAEANRQNALNQMSNIGGNVNASDYGQAANAAAAQNAINATNTQARNNANVGNVANNLSGQMSNLQNAQNVNAANTAARQGQVYYNAGLPQQQFNNELAKAGGMSGLYSQQANASNQASQNSSNSTGQLIQGGATLLGTIYGGPAGGMAANAAAGAVVNNNKQQPRQMADGGMCYAEGGAAHNHYLCMLMGGPVPGEAEVPGDSPKNDKVHALLSPGEIVVKRSKAANPEEAAKEAKRISLEHFSKGYRRGK
jgi:hypothetical protein